MADTNDDGGTVRRRFGARLAIAALALAAALAACATNPESATTPAAAAIELPANCRPDTDFSQAQFIIGYGSLMEQSSRLRTTPGAGPARPVTVHGFRRAWIARGRATGFSTTFLGVAPDAAGELNAVVYEVFDDEVARTDAREGGYCRWPVPAAQFRVLDGAEPPRGQAWIYVNRPENVAGPSARFPIVQSYVDVFLSGCLQVEAASGIEGFARQCVRTTHGWSKHWVNDRLYPRRPFIHQPRAFAIDRLLHAEIPGYFDAIRIE